MSYSSYHNSRFLSRLALVLVFQFVLLSAAYAQNRLKLYEQYINKYKELAQSQQKKYKIPSSITLAQGLLESGAGHSKLALKSNNHFGIKCHNGWRGETVIAADDRPNDCFRKYKKVEDSYTDHSCFLTRNARYRNLFNLEVTDYKGWAKGLQKDGYATDRAYANKIIKLIEDYRLFQYDRNFKKNKRKYTVEKQTMTPRYKHTPYKTFGLVYVIAQRGDSFEEIAQEFGLKSKDLYKFNEVKKGFPLSEGDLVYFQKKKKKADKPYYEHVVKVGESMYSISQLYGIQVRRLYKINKKDADYVPTEGDVLRLR